MANFVGDKVAMHLNPQIRHFGRDAKGKSGDSCIHYQPIGYVETGFSVPVPRELLKSGDSRIVLEPKLEEGLQGLRPGQQLLVLFHCHLSEGFELQQHPHGDEKEPKLGVFALRSPDRPNPIGVTIVDLLGVGEHVLWVKGLDAVEGTPVLDLKPVYREAAFEDLESLRGMLKPRSCV